MNESSLVNKYIETIQILGRYEADVCGKCNY